MRKKQSNYDILAVVNIVIQYYTSYIVELIFIIYKSKLFIINE